MFFFENGSLEFIWLWVLWFWPLPFFLRLLPAGERSVQALRVPFFHRITVLPQSGFSEGKNIKSLVLAGLVWSLIILQHYGLNGWEIQWNYPFRDEV